METLRKQMKNFLGITQTDENAYKCSDYRTRMFAEFLYYDNIKLQDECAKKLLEEYLTNISEKLFDKKFPDADWS